MPTNTDLVSQLPADFEVFGQAVDTSLADLKGGTTGQVLKKNTNADMDFVWAADSAGMTNPMTTTGDTIYSSSGSTPARLGIGTTGQVLTVSGGVPSWATPASGANANWSLVNTGGTALSGSNTTTVSFTAKDKIMMYLVNATSAQTGISAFEISVRVNGSSSGIYNYTGPYLSIGSAYTSFVGAVSDGSSATSARFSEWSSQAASATSGTFFISGAATSGVKVIQFQSGSTPAGGFGQDLIWGGGFINTTSTITSVSVVQTQGQNFNGGTLFVYTSD